jgi:para-aminobenzoate synthetase
MPTARLRKAGRATEVNRLEVSPQGHELFDDILMSALILERLRTTPSV